MMKTIKKWVPITYDAFVDYRVGGMELSAKGKTVIQKMIKEHLGWLVVWGGFFGGFLGLVLSPIGFNIL